MASISGSSDIQSQQAVLPDADPEPTIGKGIGRNSVTAVETSTIYMGQPLQPTSSKNLPGGIALRERMTKVIPDEAFRLLLSSAKPSQVRQANRKPVPQEAIPSRVSTPESGTSVQSPATSDVLSPKQKLPETPASPQSGNFTISEIVVTPAVPQTTDIEYENQIAEVRSLAGDDDGTESVQNTGEHNDNDSPELAVDKLKAIVLTTNELVSEAKNQLETGSSGDAVFPLRSEELKRELARVAEEQGLPDVTDDPETQHLLEEYLTVRLDREGVVAVKVQTLEDEKDSQLAGTGENRDIPPLVSSSREQVSAAPLPKALQKILTAGLKATDQKELNKQFSAYTTAVIHYVQKNFTGAPPSELQEAFYNGMIELGTHGDYLKSIDFTVEGVTRTKPQNKKKLALLASTLSQIQQAGQAKDESQVGSTTSTFTRKGLYSQEQQDLLFRTCMGLEPVSGIALRADLKSAFKDIDKLIKKLENPELPEAGRKQLEGELKYRRAGIETIREKIRQHDDVMSKGQARCLDDVWDHSYGRLEERLTQRLHSKLKTYHGRAIRPGARKQFYNPDAIINAAATELRDNARKTAAGQKKQLEQGRTVEELTSEILAKRNNSIRGILGRAIDASRRSKSTGQ